MSASTIFGAFLDGFTGAGLTRKLSIPGEPILGFAPAPSSLESSLSLALKNSAQILTSDLTLRIAEADLQFNEAKARFAEAEAEMIRIELLRRMLDLGLELRIDESGKLVAKHISAPAETQQTKSDDTSITSAAYKRST
jgi:hypothetical protein